MKYTVSKVKDEEDTYSYRGITFEVIKSIPHGYYGRYRATSRKIGSTSCRKSMLVTIDQYLENTK